MKDFWLYVYPKYSARYRAEAFAPIQSKIGAFLADPVLRRVLTAAEKPLHLRKIMDEGKILLVN
ncbi:MAG: type IV secretory system conjugative DNA transfer family protein, partial [Gammaproteobacteria bacterium]|nr:type IV secretory system conjugative DNA transfer family protein [Gammaproteobacteria bacterium]